MMKFGFYADNELPKASNPDYKTNSLGYRCPEFSPLPVGGKNVVILGCSHTFGVGLEEHEIWHSKLSGLLTKENLRFWNLGQPGASPEKCVRILYGCEKVLFPKIIIVCWPVSTRRERLEEYPLDLTGGNILLKTENNFTDKHNLLKCVFLIEKFAEYNHAKVFHCFTDEIYHINGVNSITEVSLKTCWPEWDKHGTRKHINTPSLARDGLHYGVEHHEAFAKKIYYKFGSKLK